MPISGRDELAKRLCDALGVPWPCDRLVIEVTMDAPVRVYVRGYVEKDAMRRVCEAFEVIGVRDVIVADDCSVATVPHAEAAG